MNEIGIVFSLESPQKQNTRINISISEKVESNLIYKFIVGSDGTWETLKDYGREDSIDWIPKKEGIYTIMVQARKPGSTKSFDYASRAEYIIGKPENKKLIKKVYLDKDKLTVGEKLNLTVEVNKLPAVYRYWIKQNGKWELIKDYSAENNLVWTVKNPGQQEILVESKLLDSKNRFDDFQNVSFVVEGIKKVEITDFRCLNPEMVVDNELVFQVDTVQDDEREILCKFIKVSADGSKTCIQDYSTKRMTSFEEKESGSYRLLCYVKDMYSQREYDDRALINYTIKPYKDIFIKSFTSDLNSPQVCETAVTFTAVVAGGRDLQYRYIISGEVSEDSGYIRDNTYVWSTKKPGQYKIELWVKDVSFEDKYEAAASMDFTIDELCKDPVVINEVMVDKKGRILTGEVAHVKVKAAGGIELRYSFIEKKNGQVIHSIDYGTCNWVDFAAEEEGNYELEVRVKDKYSSREYDSHSVVYLEVYEYVPAVIEQILMHSKEHYIVGDSVAFSVITQNTSKSLFKYILNINNQIAEETDYEKANKYIFTPKCSGSYTIRIFAKNADSTKEFDSVKEVKIRVLEALPITNTKIICDIPQIKVNEAVTFTASCQGGKEVLYQFYMMNKEDWTLVQNYSRKDYYSFMPFTAGKYRLLVLSKSSLKKCAYEDYAIHEFTVE